MEETKENKISKVSKVLGFPWTVFIFLLIIVGVYTLGTMALYRQSIAQNTRVETRLMNIEQGIINQVSVPVVPVGEVAPVTTPSPTPKSKKMVEPDLLGGEAASTSVQKVN